MASARDIEAELGRIGHQLAPLEIVLVNTSAGAAYGRPDYVSKGCGMGREATLYLLERGVRVTGTDGWSGTRRSCTPRRNISPPAMRV